MPTLHDSVVLVTGANGGIGTEFVNQALALGARVVYTTARTPRTWTDPRIVPLTLDINDADSVAAAVTAAPDVNVLINNAGSLPDSASVLELTEAQLRQGMETNFFGPVMLAKAFAPVLTAHPESILSTCTRWPAGTRSAASTAPPRLHSGRRPTPCGSSSPPWACTSPVCTSATSTPPWRPTPTAPRCSRASFVTTVFDAVGAGEYEVIADEISATVKAALSAPVHGSLPGATAMKAFVVDRYKSPLHEARCPRARRRRARRPRRRSRPPGSTSWTRRSAPGSSSRSSRTRCP